MFDGFSDTIQGPAPVYTRVIRRAAGLYRLEISVKDLATNKIATDSIAFEVK